MLLIGNISLLSEEMLVRQDMLTKSEERLGEAAVALAYEYDVFAKGLLGTGRRKALGKLGNLFGFSEVRCSDLDDREEADGLDLPVLYDAGRVREAIVPVDEFAFYADMPFAVYKGPILNAEMEKFAILSSGYHLGSLLSNILVIAGDEDGLFEVSRTYEIVHAMTEGHESRELVELVCDMTGLANCDDPYMKVRMGRNSAGKAFPGCLGFEDFMRHVDDVYSIWRAESREAQGVLRQISGHVGPGERIRLFSELSGISEAVKAYYEGVPISDIVGKAGTAA